MPIRQNDELMFALVDFVRKVDLKTAEPGMMNQFESSAGQAVLSAIDKVVDARVNAILSTQLPNLVVNIMREHVKRTPQR